MLLLSHTRAPSSPRWVITADIERPAFDTVEYGSDIGMCSFFSYKLLAEERLQASQLYERPHRLTSLLCKFGDDERSDD
nr:hypothetical protein CFP56_38758 [Quercus suber]